MDALETDLKRRSITYENLANNYLFLVDMDASEEQLNGNVRCLMKNYPEDVDINLAGETKHLHAYIRDNYRDAARGLINDQDLYQIIIKDKIHLAFLNVETVLQLFLSLMVTNCLGERLFSLFKQIKNELQTSSREKPSVPRIMCIKSDEFCSLSL